MRWQAAKSISELPQTRNGLVHDIARKFLFLSETTVCFPDSRAKNIIDRCRGALVRNAVDRDLDPEFAKRVLLRCVDDAQKVSSTPQFGWFKSSRSTPMGPTQERRRGEPAV